MRLKAFEFALDDFALLLSGKWIQRSHNWPIPANARPLFGHWDLDRQCAVVVFEHEDFPDCPVGAVPVRERSAWDWIIGGLPAAEYVHSGVPLP